LILLGLGAYAWWIYRTHNTQDQAQASLRVGFIAEPGCFEHSSVRVTLGDQQPDCSVQGTPQEPGHEMPCKEVGAYLRQVLNPPRGAVVGVTVRGTLSRDSAIALFDDLTAHGFEAGGSECFISEPGGER